MTAVTITRKGAVAEIAINRPEAHNALNIEVLEGLEKAFAEIASDPALRAVVLSGEGKSFCAGADLHLMKGSVSASLETAVAESLSFARLLAAMDECPKPVVAVVHGACLGGGVGLAATADIVLAHDGVRFGFSEVKIGLAPSVISPFVIRRIGLKNARRYFLTGERIAAATALSIGLADEVFGDAGHGAALETILSHFLSNGPNAMAEIKKLVRMNRQCAGASGEREALTRFTAEHIASLRGSSEAREGMSAFLEKRRPAYATA